MNIQTTPPSFHTARTKRGFLNLSVIAKAITSLATITALTACGGSGGESGATATTAPVLQIPLVQATVVQTPQVTTDKTLQTSVPAFTYAADSQELAAITILNERRAKCGFGLLKQNALLDKAAAAHAAYIAQPVQGVYSHFEQRGLADAYFTGISPADRAIFQGYTTANKNIVDEELVAELNNTDSFVKSGLGYGAYGTIRLMQAPFHLIGMLRSNRDVGVGFSSVFRSALIGSVNALVFNASYSSDTQDFEGIQTFPCNGNVVETFFDGNETPQPFPSRSYVNNPMGHPMAVMANSGTSVLINSAVLVNAATNAAVVVNVLSNATSPVSLNKNEILLVPDVALAKNSTYKMTIVGTLDGAPWNKVITFATNAN
jgi:hypothetical protein